MPFGGTVEQDQPPVRIDGVEAVGHGLQDRPHPALVVGEQTRLLPRGAHVLNQAVEALCLLVGRQLGQVFGLYDTAHPVGKDQLLLEGEVLARQHAVDVRSPLGERFRVHNVEHGLSDHVLAPPAKPLLERPVHEPVPQILVDMRDEHGQRVRQHPQLLLTVGKRGPGLAGGELRLEHALAGRCFAAKVRQPKRPGHTRAQLLGVEGLHDMIVGPGLQAFHPGLFTGARGQKDDRDGGRGRVRPQLPKQREPVQAWHHDVRQDEIGCDPLCRRQGFRAVRDRRHLIVVAQQALDIGAHVRVVVGQKKMRPRVGQGRPGRYRLSGQPTKRFFDIGVCPGGSGG